MRKYKVHAYDTLVLGLRSNTCRLEGRAGAAVCECLWLTLEETMEIRSTVCTAHLWEPRRRSCTSCGRLGARAQPLRCAAHAITVAQRMAACSLWAAAWCACIATAECAATAQPLHSRLARLHSHCRARAYCDNHACGAHTVTFTLVERIQ